MSPSLRAATALAFAALTATASAQAQSIPIELPTVYAPPEASPAATTLPPQLLDQLVAPIALYPDPLLTDILAASTYPAQLAEAQRFAAAHQGVQGTAVNEEAAGHHWDQSVQALLQFPQVLQFLDGNLEWTDRLGQAFIAQQADVLNAIQRLRQRAEAAGTLANTPQDEVVHEGGDIAILPPSDQQIYVPSYDAACVYGAYAGCGDDGIAWGDGLWLPDGILAWGVLEWSHRRIAYNGPHHDGGAGYHGGWGLHGGDAGIWHHEGGTPLAFGRAPAEIGGMTHFAPDPGRLGNMMRGQPAMDRFNYAPPAGEFFGPGRFGGGLGTRPIVPRPISPAGFGRGPAFGGGSRAPAAAMRGGAAPFAPAGGVGGRR